MLKSIEDWVALSRSLLAALNGKAAATNVMDTKAQKDSSHDVGP